MDSIYRVMGFDPGSSHFGVSVFEIDLSENEPLPKLVYCESKCIDSWLTLYADRFPLATKRQLRHEILYDLTLGLLKEFNPHSVVCESNYLGKFANAFSALVECVYTHRRSLADYDSDIDLWLVEPSVAKKMIGAPPKGKEGVKEAVLACGLFKTILDLSERDEHAVDSVAIGFWGVVELILNISWLFWRDYNVEHFLSAVVVETKLPRTKRRIRGKITRRRSRRRKLGKVSKLP